MKIYKTIAKTRIIHFFTALVMTMFFISLSGCTSPALPAGHVLKADADIQPWKFANVNGYKITTERYQIFSTAKLEFAQRMAAFMEATADNYDSLTGLSPQKATTGKTEYMKVYIFANRQQWASLTKVITGQSSDTALKISAGGYCFRGICVFWDIGIEGTSRIAAHEGLHQYLHHRLYHRLPAWADEGLAVLAEGFELDRTGAVHFDYTKNHGRKVTLRKLSYAKRGRKISELCSISSADNLNQTPLFTTDYYAQLWSLMNMIKSDTKTDSAFKQMCRDAASGKLRANLGIDRVLWSTLQGNYNDYSRVAGSAALEKYILPASGTDIEALELNFEKFSRNLADIEY